MQNIILNSSAYQFVALRHIRKMTAICIFTAHFKMCIFSSFLIQDKWYFSARVNERLFYRISLMTSRGLINTERWFWSNFWSGVQKSVDQKQIKNSHNLMTSSVFLFCFSGDSQRSDLAACRVARRARECGRQSFGLVCREAEDQTKKDSVL